MSHDEVIMIGPSLSEKLYTDRGHLVILGLDIVQVQIAWLIQVGWCKYWHLYYCTFFFGGGGVGLCHKIEKKTVKYIVVLDVPARF